VGRDDEWVFRLHGGCKTGGFGQQRQIESGAPMSSQKPFDDAFKEIAEHGAEDLLRLIGALPSDARIVEALPREVSAQALLPDQPYKIEVAGERRVAHLEAETRYKSNLLHRVAGYQTRLWLDHQLPVYTYVIVFSPAGMPRRVPSRLTINVGHLRIATRCEIIRLWKLSAKKALAFENEYLLPMIPLMEGGAEELLHGIRALCDIADQDRQRMLAANFFILGSLRYPKAELLNSLLGGTNMLITREVLRETPMYQDILEEGREEGREEGHRQALFNLIGRFLERRFPNSEPVEEVLMIRDVSALEQLCLEMDRFSDLGAFRQRTLDLIERSNDSSKID
jgi:predicted transposase YdaD